MTLIAQSLGIVDVHWDSTLNEFFFFGLTNAPGTSFTIVPEPSTAVLLAVGLLGLAVRRRARA